MAYPGRLAIASKISARLQENLSEAARDFGLGNGIDALGGLTGNGKYLENGSLVTEESLKETRRLLVSNRDREREDGLRRVLAIMSKGRPVSSFFPLVTSCLSSNSLVLRALVSIYVLRQAPTEPDLALMSVNMYQKDLNDSNPAVRAMALRVLTGMQLDATAGLVITSLKRACRDSNYHVRRTVAHCLTTLYTQDSSHLSAIISALDMLLNDKSAIVVGAAAASYNDMIPDRFDVLHRKYRHMCQSLIDCDEWGQSALLFVLTRYARANLPKPSSEEDLDGDLELLLMCAEPLLQSRHPAVTAQVSRLFYRVAPTSMLSKIVAPLLRLLHASEEIAQAALVDICAISHAFPDLFRKHLVEFYVRSSDALVTRCVKLDIMINLLSSDNAEQVLKELQVYATSTFDPEFASQSLKALGKAASTHQQLTQQCTHVILRFLHSSDDKLIEQSVIVLRDLLQSSSFDASMRPGVIRHLVSFLYQDDKHKVRQAQARASILWMVGHWADEHALSSYGPDLVRLAAREFVNEATISKIEIVNISAKFLLLAHVSGPATPLWRTCAQLFDYITTLARYDLSYPLRDRARFVRGMLITAKVPFEITSAEDGLALDSFQRGRDVYPSETHRHSNGAGDIDESNAVPLLTAAKVQDMLCAGAPSEEALPEHKLGSLSSMTGKPVFDAAPIPDWTSQPTPHAVRDPEVEQQTVTSTAQSFEHQHRAGSVSSMSSSSATLPLRTSTGQPVVLTPTSLGGIIAPKPGTRNLDQFLAESSSESGSDETTDDSEGTDSTGGESEASSEEDSE